MKHFTILVLLALTALSLSAQNNVTFQVDMNQYGGTFTTPEVNGDFNGWCGNCNPMTDTNNDGVWETTLPLTQDSIEFKYAHDSWTGQETLTEGSACTKTTSGFTNRFIHINGDTTLPVVCWEACDACALPPDTSMVTFQLDMTQYTGTFTTPEVNGDFNGWCGNCNVMSDSNGDNIWEVTLPLINDSIEYKFSYDAWGDQETLTEGTSCTKTTGGFTNRFKVLTGDVVLPAVCWESCEECFVPVDSAMVTFKVDMSEYTGAYTTPEVNGTFNGWCGNCNAMDDTDGDDIWEITIELPEDTIEYKFSFDTWTGQEGLTEGDPCVLTTDGFTNRFFVIPGDTVLPAVCWNSCDPCATDTTDTVTGINPTIDISTNIYPNPADQSIMIDWNNWDAEIVQVDIFNALGARVVSVNKTGNQLQEIGTTNLDNGMYTIIISSDSKRSIHKMIISH